MPSFRCSVADFGAVGDGETDNTRAFRVAVPECARRAQLASRNRFELTVPPGEYVTGAFNLTSHMKLFLAPGAVLLASTSAAMTTNAPRRPTLCVLDLDMCVWAPEMYELHHMPVETRRGPLAAGRGDGVVAALSGTEAISLFPGAMRAMQEVYDGEHGDMRLAVASSPEEAGVGGVLRMPSRAIHDASPMAKVMPSAMLFIPSVDGISHSYDEHTYDNDIAVGAKAFVGAAAGILLKQCAGPSPPLSGGSADEVDMAMDLD